MAAAKGRRAPRKGAAAGQFAKRTVASTKLSKRIGWLNRNAGLAQEIRFSEVKDLLSQVGEAEAMRILSNLEEQATQGSGAKVRNPTGYVKAAAQRIAEQSPVKAKGSDGRRKAGNRRKTKAQVLAKRPEELAQKIEKRIEWLNSNAGLQQALNPSTVADQLGSAGWKKAMTVLKRLEEQRDQVPDPDSFVLTGLKEEIMEDEEVEELPAVVDAGGGDGGGAKKGQRGRKRQSTVPPPPGLAAPARAPGDRRVIKTALKEKPRQAFAEQIARRVGWLNSNAALSQPINLNKVQNPLVRTGNRAEVMKVLKILEENAAQVRDPTAYVIRAAKNMVVTEYGDNYSYAGEPVDAKLSKKIGQLNRSTSLASPIDFDQVAEYFQGLARATGLDILQRLEQSAAQVRDPTAYLIAAAKRAYEDEYYAPPAFVPASAAGTAEGKLLKRIAWLNNNIELAAPLNYERVAPELLAGELSTALEVLNALEENAASVRDPNGYVVARARREGGNPQDDKIAKRVTWLNSNVCSSVPLDLDQVVPALSELQMSQAMGILKDFEESAHEVRNPTAFVIAAARRAGMTWEEPQASARPAIGAPPPSRAPAWSRQSSAGSADSRTAIGYPGGVARASGNRSAPMLALPGAPAMDGKTTFYGGVEEKLRKRIEWLNGNVPMAAPLPAERLVPELLKVTAKEGMEFLKTFEESAPEIRDPTGFVLSLVRRQTAPSRKRK